jgi:hypothetical protein
MAERFLHIRKLDAMQRRCLAQGKMVLRTEDGKIYCGKKTKLSSEERAKAKELLRDATVERLKSFLVLKGFHGFSRLRKQELINLIFHRTDAYTGDVILHSPRKSRRKSRSKDSRRRSRTKESRGRKQK